MKTPTIFMNGQGKILMMRERKREEANRGGCGEGRRKKEDEEGKFWEWLSPWGSDRN